VIRDNNGQAIAHIGSVRDINEQKKAEDALKAEEVIKTDLLKKLNEAQHNAKIGSLDWNLVSKQVWWSDELYRIFELDPETFTPSVESNSKYVHPDDTEEFHKEAFRIIETKEELDYDLRIITANGNLKHCNIRAKTECNSAGNPLRFYGTFSDITERKKVEADLLNASLYNRSLIEASIDPLVTIGHDGRIMDVNRATEQFTGVNCETLIGSEFSNYYTEPNKAKHGYLQVLEQGKVTDYPLTMQHISGRTFDVLYNATIYKNADGSVAGVFAAARDITERKLAEKALDESRKLYKLLAENSTDGVSMIDADGKVIYVSPAYLRRLGYTEEDWIGADTIGILNQLHPDDTGRIGAEIKRGRKLKLPTTKYEYRVRTKSGEYIWLEDVLHREFDSDGRFVHTIVNSRIITERKLSEQLLLESEEKYKRIFSTERDSMFLIDQETGSFLDFNDAACELYGYSRDEMFNLKTYDLSAEQEETKRAMHYLNDWNEFRNHRKKDGTIFPVDISASHFTWKGKSVLLTAIRDISSFKRIEHSLQTSNDRYDKLTSTIPVGVYVLNNKLDGTTAFEYISSKVPELIGVDIENLKADAFLLIKFIHPDDKESFMKLVKEEFRTTLNQLDWKGRFVVDGKTKWLQIISTPEMLENGDISRHGLIIDITENVLAEADIQSKNDELAKSLSEKDKFFSIIAHDLRSPFNGLLGFTTMLSEDLPDLNMEQIQTIADLLKKSATNAYNLVVNLLEWSQMQRGITVFNPEQFYLILKIKEILQALLEQAHKKGIQINSQIPENLVIFADLNMISSTIRNLVSNAIKFTPKGGRIVISAISGSGGCTEIKVKDNGIGMSQSLISKLFVLAENTGRKGTDNEPSSGLGLNLCKEFVEKHGGKIWAESEEGNGSTFHFTLPEPGFGGDL
jgi:PAS domain S-box-containing protein